jgi:hypothetical protein
MVDFFKELKLNRSQIVRCFAKLLVDYFLTEIIFCISFSVTSHYSPLIKAIRFKLAKTR